MDVTKICGVKQTDYSWDENSSAVVQLFNFQFVCFLKDKIKNEKFNVIWG